MRFVHQHSEMNAKYRSSMEDEHRYVGNFGGDPHSHFFAVYDGHGGRGIVDYLKTSVERNLIIELDFALRAENGSRSVEEALSAAYLISDIETSKENLMVSGSTAVTVLLRKEEDGRRMLYSANVGDSRAVLGVNGAARRLTFDHKASDPSEIRRIEASGGFIIRKRVCGVLSVSRSFGDHGLKKYVLARPYTSHVELKENDENLLIVACDGIWDVFSDQEALEFVRGHLHRGGSRDDGGEVVSSSTAGEENLAKLLIEEALRRGTTDNCTAIVALL